jgi:hypothetical protein
MHEPLDNKLGHYANFRVKYRFYSKEEGGRQTIVPFQGYRSDFWYEHPDHSGTNQLFMIWPEFENGKTEVILEDQKSVPVEGTARMWIIDPKRRHYHRDKIHVGLKGYFMEGSKRVAECEVIEILGLQKNPTQSNE